MPRGGGEQRGLELDRFALLPRGERLQPRLLEHDLVTIVLGSQRHQLAATTGIRFQHSLMGHGEGCRL